MKTTPLKTDRQLRLDVEDAISKQLPEKVPQQPGTDHGQQLA